MAFILIKGTFHVVGYQPDGDSIRFQADDLSKWGLLAGPTVEVNARGHAQLRIEAIDTLETHYGGQHQPMKFAKAALDALLKELGIKDVKFNASGLKVTAAKDGTRGYILARQAEKNRRPVSFVFGGDSTAADGSAVFFKAAQLQQSANFKLLQAGLAFPTYYSGLFFDLRNALTAATRNARTSGKGIWPSDRTNSGFEVKTLKSVTEDSVVLPKLFRRIVSYMGSGGSITGFKSYLASNPDPVTNLKNGHFTNLDTYVDVSGKTVRLTVKPEDLVFGEA